jgi:hypothetical protein
VKLKHWIGVFLLIVGTLYLWHVVMSKSGASGFKSGLGLGGV